MNNIKTYGNSPRAIHDAIHAAIDIDEWKHSWHEKIEVENYPRLIEIISQKISNREEELKALKTIRLDMILIQRDYQ